MGNNYAEICHQGTAILQLGSVAASPFISLSVILTTIFVIYGNTEFRSRAANGSAYQDVCAGLTGYRRMMCEETNGAFTQPKVKEGTPCKKGDPEKPCGINGTISCSLNSSGKYTYNTCYDLNSVGIPKCKVGSTRPKAASYSRNEYIASNDTFHLWTDKCTKEVCELREDNITTHFVETNCKQINHKYISRKEGVARGLCGPGDCVEHAICEQDPGNICTPGEVSCGGDPTVPGDTWVRKCMSIVSSECSGMTFTYYLGEMCGPGKTCVELGNNKAECR